MIAFIGVISTLGLIGFLVLLIVWIIKKKPKKVPAIGLAACFVLLAAALALDSGPDAENNDIAGAGSPMPSASEDISAAPTARPSPAQTAEPTPEPSVNPTVAPAPSPTQQAAPEAASTATPNPVQTASPAQTVSPAPEPTPKPAASGQTSTQAGGSPTANSGGNSGDSTGNADNFNTYDNPEQQQTQANYILNTSTMKFHKPSCRDVARIAPENYAASNTTRDEVIARGYSPCGHCNP